MSDMSDAPRIESAIGKINGSPQYHLLSSIPVPTASPLRHGRLMRVAIDRPVLN